MVSDFHGLGLQVRNLEASECPSPYLLRYTVDGKFSASAFTFVSSLYPIHT